MKRKGMLSIVFLAATVMISLYSCSVNSTKEKNKAEEHTYKVQIQDKKSNNKNTLEKPSEKQAGDVLSLDEYTYENVEGEPLAEEEYEPEQYDGYY